MYAITGHTSGIGQAIFKSKQGLGFSLSNGYDIRKEEDRKRIIKESEDSKVFINNAHGGFGQALLLREVFSAWKDRPGQIVNIGVAKSGPLAWELVHETYSVEKLSSHAMCEQLQALPRSCKLTNLCLGTVENYSGLLSYKNVIDALDFVIAADYEVLKLSVC